MIPPLVLVGFVAGLLHRRFGIGPMIAVAAVWPVLIAVLVASYSGYRVIPVATAVGIANTTVGAAIGVAVAAVLRALAPRSD